jgi:hypothetical protein
LRIKVDYRPLENHWQSSIIVLVMSNDVLMWHYSSTVPACHRMRNHGVSACHEKIRQSFMHSTSVFHFYQSIISERKTVVEPSLL